MATRDISFPLHFTLHVEGSPEALESLDQFALQDWFQGHLCALVMVHLLDREKTAQNMAPLPEGTRLSSITQVSDGLQQPVKAQADS